MGSGIVNWTSVNPVIDRIIRNTGFDIDELDLITWIGEAMFEMEVSNTLEERVAFGEVEDHRIKLPKGLRFINQIARHNSYNKKWKTKKLCGYGEAYRQDVDLNMLCPVNIYEDTPENCCEKIETDCNGCAILDHKKVYYIPYFDVLMNNNSLSNNNYYKKNYTPVRLKNHSFFNSLVCKEDTELYSSYYDEYNIVGKQSELLFSFKEGSVAISYKRTILDEDGYPMVPDRIEFQKAVESYVRYRWYQKKFDTDPTQRIMFAAKNDAKQQWDNECSSAKVWAWLPKTIDDYQMVEEQYGHLMPKLNAYNNFFGNLR